MHAGDLAIREAIEKDQPRQNADSSVSRAKWQVAENAVFEHLCAVVDSTSAEDLAVKSGVLYPLWQNKKDHNSTSFAAMVIAPGW